MGHGGQLGLAGETVPWGPGRQKPVLRQGQGHAAPRVSITSFGLCFLMAVPGPSVPPSPAPRICHGLSAAARPGHCRDQSEAGSEPDFLSTCFVTLDKQPL